MELAPLQFRHRLGAVSGIVVALFLTVAACGADEAKEVILAKLAVGSWDCAPSADGATESPFTVRIEEAGTFAVALDSETARPPRAEISGTWSIEDGDLEWGYDLRQDLGKVRIEGFESLTPESTGFTLTNPGFFEATDGNDDPADEQNVIVRARGTDSVTLRVPGGDPWTCNRQ